MAVSQSGIQGRAIILDADQSGSASRREQLESFGWETILTATTGETLDAACQGEADVVVLHTGSRPDRIPGLPGLLRQAAEVPHLPVIVLAREPSEEIRCRFLDRGANDVAPHDISPTELDARLRALMRVKVLQDELHASRQALSGSLQRERALLRQLRRDNAHLLTLCTIDPLTHLQNIRYFDTFLENEFKIARRYARSLSLLTLDLDHFKVVNDTHGHPSGDYVLKELAVILKRSVRDSDVVARTGGEEFSIILPNAGRIQASRFARRIRRALKDRQFIVFGETIHVTTSIGTASYPEDAEITNSHMLVYLADQALLRAKQLGRDRVVALSELDGPARRQLCQQFKTSQPRRMKTAVDPIIAANARR